MSLTDQPLPLSGIKVLEVGHAVMGPAAGLILADMGAEVIKIERTPKGDHTRYLKGFGIGFFPYYNRNKKSLCLNLKDEKGREILYRLVEDSDVFIENLGPGTMDKLGMGYQKLTEINPRLIYCSLKGFMPGPYENRLALDEVVQMMGGLAYMTGPKGMPLRAGASVTDIMGGTYGVVGILTALYDRERTGRGQHVRSALFESVAFMMGQHMTCAAVTGEPAPPMPERVSAWSVYQLFNTKEGEKIFIGATSDQQWQRFCRTFGFKDLLEDDRLATNNQRIEQRDWLISELKRRISAFSKSELLDMAEKANIPFSPVAKPEELFEDPQLNEGGSLMETVLPGGIKTKLPRIPVRVGSYDFNLRNNPPEVGEGSQEVLKSIGLTKKEIDELDKSGVIALFGERDMIQE